jgi:hypothetical protein
MSYINEVLELQNNNKYKTLLIRLFKAYASLFFGIKKF